MKCTKEHGDGKMGEVYGIGDHSYPERWKSLHSFQLENGMDFEAESQGHS